MTKSFTKIFSAIVFVLFAAALSGQTTFSVTPVESHVNWNTGQASATIKNLTNEELSIRWQRFIYGMENDTNNCAIGIYSPFLEYPAGISTHTFHLPANFEGEFGAIFFGCTIDTILFCAITVLRLHNIDLPTDTAYTGFIFGNCPVVSDNEPTKSQINVYPNPVNDMITLSNATVVAGIRVLNIIGSQVAYFNAAPNHNYDLSSLPSGSYILLAEDKNHQFLQVLKIQKR